MTRVRADLKEALRALMYLASRVKIDDVLMAMYPVRSALKRKKRKP